MWSLFRNFFNFRKIKLVDSPINGLIQVVWVFNRPRIMIGNLVQSGGAVVKPWEQAILRLTHKPRSISKVLILGLGCGDCAFAVSRHYSKAQMTGVEIDPKIIELAQSYFNLATLRNLTIKIGDAIEFIKTPPLKSYDLIIVDAYLGSKIPKSFTTPGFLKQLKSLLKDSGIIVFNQLYYDDKKLSAERFVLSLEKIFPHIELKHIGSNLLIYAQIS